MEPVTYERRGAAAVVTIDRQERRNAVDGPTADLLAEAYERFEADDDARVMVLTGAGDVAFCAGADLKAIESFGPRMDARAARSASRAGSPPSPRSPRSRAGAWPAAWSWRSGATCGSPPTTAALGFPERRWGVPLIDGGTQRLPRIVGLGRALDLILTGRIVEARRGARDGARHRGRAGRAATSSRALEIAEALARFPQDTMLADRRAAIEGFGLPLPEALALEARSGRATLETAWRGAGALRRRRGPRRRGRRRLSRERRARDRGLGPRKSYGPVDAVRGLSFSVEQGEVFGLLGPNGAGKTTTVEILEGYRPRIGGPGERARARPGGPRPPPPGAGRDRAPELRLLPAGDGARGGGDTSPRPTPRRATPARRSRWSGSSEKADARTAELCGGQRRRLDLALALIGDPELVFLDEPTTGFDPAARRTAWSAVRDLEELGKTVLLTTHYLDEAQELADRVAIVKDGRIVAAGPARPSSGPDQARYRVSYLSVGPPGRAPDRRPHRPASPPDQRRAGARRAARGPRGQPADARGRLPRADRREAPDERGRARLGAVPLRAQAVLAQPDGGVLQLRPAAAAAGPDRHGVRQRGRRAGRPDPRRRRHERDGHDLHRARVRASSTGARRASSSACAARRCRPPPTSAG